MVKIPIAYQVMIDRLDGSAFKGELAMAHTRRIMRHHFRIPQNKVLNILSELKTMKLIQFCDRRTIKINYNAITWERQIQNGKI